MAVTVGDVQGLEVATVSTPWAARSLSLALDDNYLLVLVSFEANIAITSVTASDGVNTRNLIATHTAGPGSGTNSFVHAYYLHSSDPGGWLTAGPINVVVTPATAMAGYLCAWLLKSGTPGAPTRSNTAVSNSTNNIAVTLSDVPAGSFIGSGINHNSAGTPALSGTAGPTATTRFTDNDAAGGQCATYGDSLPVALGTVTHTYTTGAAQRAAVLMVEVLESNVPVALDAGAVGVAGADLNVNVVILEAGAVAAAGVDLGVLEARTVILDVGTATAVGEDLTPLATAALDAGSMTAAGDDLVVVEFPSERVSANVIVASTNLSGAIGDVDEDVGSPDGSWLTATSAAADTVLHVGFGTPAASLKVGPGLQQFRLWVRKTAGVSSPTLAVELREDGGLLASLLAGASVTSTTGQLVEATWDADLLAQVSGSGVELRAVGSAGGSGTPGALPAYDSRGGLSVSTLNGTATRSYDLPNVLAAGDIEVLFVAFVGGSTRSLNAVNTPGWSTPQNFGGDGDAIQLGLTWRRVASSAESDGDVSVSITGTSTLPLPRVARFTAANGFATVPLVGFTAAVVDPTGTTLDLPTVTPTGANQLAACLVVTNVNTAISSGVGEVGGNWNASAFDYQNATVSPAAVSLQLSDQSGGGAVSGGTVSWTGSGAAIAVGFVLAPAAAGVNTVEFGAVDWVASLVEDAATVTLDSGAVATSAGNDLVFPTAVPLDVGAVAVAGNDVLASGPITLDGGATAAVGADLLVRTTIGLDTGGMTAAGNDLLVAVAIDSGAVSVAGNDLLASGPITLDAGALSSAGNDLLVRTAVLLDAGTAAVAGNDLAFMQSGAVTLDTGAVTIAGNDLLAAVRVPLDTGTLAVAGNDVTPLIASTVVLDTGAVAVAGNNLVTPENVTIVLDTGAVAAAGADMVPLNGGLLTFDVGAVALAGADASPNLAVQLDVRPLIAIGNDLSPNLAIAIDQGSITVVNEELGVFQAGTVPLDSGAVAAFSNDIVFLGDRILVLETGTVAIAGADLSFPAVVPLDSGALAVAGADLTTSAAGTVTIDVGGVGVTGADVNPGYLSFTLEDGAVLVAANDLGAAQRVVLDAGAVSVVGQVLADRVVLAGGAVGVAGNDMAPSTGFPSDFEHGQHFPGIVFSTGERFEVAA